MIDHGIVKSAIRPEPMVVDEFSVWVHTDIQEITETGPAGEEIKGFQYQMTQYSKDEYISLLAQLRADVDFIAALEGVSL